jgi:hypothetical protein
MDHAQYLSAWGFFPRQYWLLGLGLVGILLVPLLILRMKRSQLLNRPRRLFGLSLAISTLVATVAAEVSVLILMGLVVRGIPFQSAILLAGGAGALTAFAAPLFTLRGFRPTRSLALSRRSLLTLVAGLAALAIQLFVLSGVGLSACGPQGASDAANLNGIGKGLELYREEIGEYPSDLRQLVDTRLINPRALVSVRSDWTDVPPGTDFPYTGPCGWYYASLKPDAPAETLRAWRMPNGPGDDFLYALQSDGDVPSLTPGELAELLRVSRPFFDGPISGPSPSSTVAPAPTPAPASVVAARAAD